jgi:hypothetical protein
MKTPESRTLGLAKWLEDYAEVTWPVADNEKIKWEARRMMACAAELRRYERMKIWFKDQLSPMRAARGLAAPVSPGSLGGGTA